VRWRGIPIWPDGRWRLVDLSGRIGVRLLVVNLVVLLVPIAGLEFARLYERQLLASLERDMRNQATLVRAHLEAARGAAPAPPADWARSEEAVLAESARTTRTRVRVLDASGAVVADSHREGPPEGAEPSPPSMLPSEVGSGTRSRGDDYGAPRWPDVPQREEVKGALGGTRSTITRVRGRAPEVLLFLAEPIRVGGRVDGVVYVTRSTQPVLVELYKIRAGLLQVLAVAVAVTGAITLLLAWSISRPLVRLSRAAQRVAAGELAVEVPVTGSGEIRELGAAFATMKERLVARLRFASDFTADVAHELKSPLTSIRGAAEILNEAGFEDEDARKRFLRNIALDVERLDRLVSRLLLLGRIEASQLPMEPVDLERLARRVAERSASVDQAVVVQLVGEAPVVLGRAPDLEAALSNLVDNAVRFSPPGASVVVEIQRRGAVVEVRVADQGPGVSAANRDKIFERFFTTDADRGGTGLGLAIVRSVCESHGGRVTFEPRPGGGSVFTMRLRAAA
jgi:two-component system sensor histidine kinase ChvG